MTIRAEDLPLSVRRDLGLPATARKRPRTTSRTGPHQPVEAGYWRCPCGHTSSVWDPMERHANACARRVEIDLTRATDPKESHA